MNAPVIQSLFAPFNGENRPGASAVVLRDSDPIFLYCCGCANLATLSPCDANTNYRLASLTKQFTAAAILLVAARGALSLDDSLPELLVAPKVPATWNKITVRQLLTHTSGLIDYEDLIPASATIRLSDRDVLRLLAQEDKTYFPPGAGFHYSNGGYALLALVVERVSGKSFAEFLRDEIFLPLKMTTTVAYEPGVSTVSQRALGYAAISPDTFVESDQSTTSAVLGDGGIYSSITDLIKWDAALYGGKLISRPLLDEAFQPWSRTSDFANNGYGYGWYVDLASPTPHLWHYGSTCGFSTRIDRFPEEKLSIILLANRRDVEFGELSRRLQREFGL